MTNNISSTVAPGTLQPGAATASSVVQERPTTTLRQVKTFAEAVIAGRYVAAEVVAERVAVCQQCDKKRVTRAGVEWCAVCGCKVSRKEKEVTNLAAYVENLPKWGCKHPLRKKGHGWPLPAASTAKNDGAQSSSVKTSAAQPTVPSGPVQTKV